MIKIDKKQWLLNLLISLIVFLVFIVFIEGLLSLLNIGSVEKFRGWGYNPECCGDLRPNQKIMASLSSGHPYLIETNSSGLRDNDEVSLVADKKRILAVGDSFTFGPFVANQETWPAYLEQEYQDKIEVINAGVPAYSIKEEAAYIKEKGRLLNPNLIILQFLANDIDDLRKNQTRLVRKSALDNQYLNKLFNFLRDRSHLLAVILDLNLKSKIGSENHASNTQSDNHELYKEYEVEFNQLIDFVKENQLKLALVVVPGVGQSQDLSLNKEIDFINNLSLKHEVPVLDLQPIFYKANRTEMLYLIPWDNHLSRYGNQLVAKETKKFIEENNLLND